MTISPTISFDVDLTNPGQFFACCGLLELASRIDPDTLGWFEEGKFHLRTTDPRLFECFLDSEVTPVQQGTANAPSPPIYIADFQLVLNWWEDATATRTGLKTWSGGQTVMGFFDGMRDHIRQMGDAGRDLLNGIVAASQPKPFYFDSRLSRLTSLDMGFSTEKFTPTYSPTVEILTLVGLQRFRPREVVAREYLGYDTWRRPLPVNIAAAVMHGLAPTLSGERYQFPLVIRTGGKYKAFGPATREKEIS